MLPSLSDFGDPGSESGIRRVVEAYAKHLPQFGVELVEKGQSYDVMAIHAGCYELYAPNERLVAISHGLYWSGDYDAPSWEHKTNARVIRSVRYAREVTVPSLWVAEAFQRDMHFTPRIIPHGIDWQDWQHDFQPGDYVLWNKNRDKDVCSTDPLFSLASLFPNWPFVSTMPVDLPNVQVTGTIPHAQMKEVVQRANVYLSTTKETFGIGVLEAMASGVPVLGFRYGGNVDLVEHGVSGYLAEPGNIEDLAEGLSYCLQHRDTLSQNAREAAKAWAWESACEKLAGVFELAMVDEPPTAAIVIPTFNYGELVNGAIESAVNQTYTDLIDIIVVDDGSEDDTEQRVKEWLEKDSRVSYVKQSNQGVANARNTGISKTNAKFITCLDADDEMEPAFLETLVPHLEADNSLGLVYSGIKVLRLHNNELLEFDSPWPPDCDFDKHIVGDCQVPTCNVFRRKAWEHLGGYRQRYAPIGMGTEDAEFWLRIGASGWSIKQVTKEPLFRYLLGGRTTGDQSYKEVDWLEWHPWTRDGWHPFASIATPDNLSHEVRQYDEPVVSVIVPVGPGHERDIIDALDSLEAQTFRKWEAIVVDDTGSDKLDLTAFPFARLVKTPGKMGAGYARNRGVEIARGQLLDFLDADDWFYPDTLWRKVEVYSAEGGDVAVYGDHHGIAIISEDYARKMKSNKKLLQYRPEDGFSLIASSNLDFDCPRAIQQPSTNRQPYIWCDISTLIPKSWHFEIGGFDEKMESWEDWDYWIRMAQIGKCFTHVNEPFLVYRFYSGNRRWAAHPEHEEGLQLAQNLVQYMQDKYRRNDTGGPSVCRGCTKKRGPSVHDSMSRLSATRNQRASTTSAPSDSDFVMCEYQGQPPGNRGNHGVVGMTVFPAPFVGFNMKRTSEGYRIDYGYWGAGGQFYVHHDDIAKTPNLFRPVELTKTNVQAALPKQRRPEPTPPPAPVVVKPTPVEQAIPEPLPQPAPEPSGPKSVAQILNETIGPVAEKAENEEDEPVTQEVAVASMFTAILESGDLQKLPGVSTTIAEQMEGQGVQTFQDILDLGVDGLSIYPGIGATRAQIIIDAINGLAAGTM